MIVSLRNNLNYRCRIYDDLDDCEYGMKDCCELCPHNPPGYEENVQERDDIHRLEERSEFREDEN